MNSLNDSPHPPRIAPGTTIGHYRVESLLSSGGFGVVYRVTRDGKSFALKLPLMDDLFEYHAELKVTEQRITREVVSLMTLKHPNIVRVHGFDRWPNAETGALYLVMDFVAGVPLLRWRDEAKPTVREVVDAFRSLALALDEMHRLGVVHRDLKSSNVLVAPETDKRFKARWRPVIVDFGLARPAFTHDVTREHSLLGTEGLWAPEQLRCALQLPDDEGRPADSGRFRFSAASDLHALGLLFYEAITGRRAFLPGGGNLAAVLTTVPRAPSTLAPELPEFLDAVAMRLLARDPAARHPSGAALADELDALLERKDARWDAVLPPADGTTDAALPAVTAHERPQPFVLTHQDGASLIEPSPLQPFFPRQSDALDALSRTAEVSAPQVPTRPAPPSPLRRDLRSGSPWRKALVLLLSSGAALAVGGVVGVAIHHGLTSRWTRAEAHPPLLGTSALPVSPLPDAAPPPVPARAAAPPPAALGPTSRALPSSTSVRPPNAPPAPPRATARAATVGRVNSGAVEAVLLEPLVHRGPALPTGTVLSGTATQLVDGLGYSLNFDRARLPTGAVQPVTAKGFAAAAAGRRQPLRAGTPPARVEFDLLFETPPARVGVR